MDNLINIGLDQDIINKLVEKEGYTSVDALNNNVDNVKRILVLIKELGVENATLFLLENTGIFYIDFDKIKSLVKSANLELLLEKIKEDNDYLAEFIYTNI